MTDQQKTWTGEPNRHVFWCDQCAKHLGSGRMTQTSCDIDDRGHKAVVCPWCYSTTRLLDDGTCALSIARTPFGNTETVIIP